MRKNLFILLTSFLFVLALAGCREKTETVTPTETGSQTEVPTEVTPEPTTPIEEGYPETNLDDGKRRAPHALEVNANGHDVIYFGEKFSPEGYDVKFLFLEYENMGTDKSLYSAVTLKNFTYDDSKVDYRKEGTYIVKITGRVRSYVLNVNVFIYLKADKYEFLGVEHLFGISCDEYVNCELGTDKSTIKPNNLIGIYTENKYEDEELIKTTKSITEGYNLDISAVDTNTPGSYPVYITYSEQYGDVKIDVETFFIVIVA